MKFLIPIILLLIGTGAGVGAGIALRPAPAEQAAASAEDSGADGSEDTAPEAHADAPARAEPEAADHAASGHDGAAPGAMEYIKLNNQFVLPIVTRDSVDAIIVMSLSLEMAAGDSETVYAREPKLRDEFLRVLFNYANVGGFRGKFTDSAKLESLRKMLLQVARNTLGPGVTAVLITDIARQEL